MTETQSFAGLSVEITAFNADTKETLCFVVVTEEGVTQPTTQLEADRVAAYLRDIGFPAHVRPA
jgi:hypothetical protein